jgi:hypothetical protein
MLRCVDVAVLDESEHAPRKRKRPARARVRAFALERQIVVVQWGAVPDRRTVARTVVARWRWWRCVAARSRGRIGTR